MSDKVPSEVSYETLNESSNEISNETFNKISNDMSSQISKGIKWPTPPKIPGIRLPQTVAREETNRNEVRAAIVAGGWFVVWGDLLNEADILTFAISIPTGTVGGWVTQQVSAQLIKFSQGLGDVADDVLAQATTFLTDLIKGNKSGERDVSGLGVKAGFATYNRKMVFTLAGRVVGKTPLPNNHNPYIALRITKPLPSKRSLTSSADIAV
ncbi:Nn.00g073440.m01.CDS01 [Neocucurbitaria sp. VM-36]